MHAHRLCRLQRIVLYVEKHGLVVALQHDIEMQHALGRSAVRDARNQRRAARGGYCAQQRIAPR